MQPASPDREPGRRRVTRGDALRALGVLAGGGLALSVPRSLDRGLAVVNSLGAQPAAAAEPSTGLATARTVDAAVAQAPWISKNLVAQASFPQPSDWIESQDPYPTRGEAWGPTSGDTTDNRLHLQEYVGEGLSRVIHTGHFEVLNYRNQNGNTAHLRVQHPEIVIAIMQGDGVYDIATDRGWSGVINHPQYGDMTQEQRAALRRDRLSEARKYKPDLTRAVVAEFNIDRGVMTGNVTSYSRSRIDDMLARQNLIQA
jgi:hypothetical protein